MAIQQVVNVDILMVGDGAATSFTFSPSRLFGMRNSDNGELGNLLTPATSVSVTGVPTGWVVPAASVDTYGNVTLTFGTAPPANIGTISVQLNFNSLALATGSAAWTSATAANTALTIPTNGFGTVVLTYNPVSSAFTLGTIVFEGSDDGGTTWYALNGERGNQSFVPDNGYILNAVQQTWQFSVGGFTNFRVRLSVAITGSGTANFKALTLPGVTDASQTVGSGLGKFMHVTIDGGNTGLVADVTAKGTQGAEALTVQDYKDSGRTFVTLTATGVAGVTSEALFSFSQNKGGTITASVSSYTITSGKTFRIQSVALSVRAGAAAVPFSRCILRSNTAGATVVGSNVVYNFGEVFGISATIGVGGNGFVNFPDGLEIAGNGTISFGVSHLDQATTNVINFTLCGYEY